MEKKKKKISGMLSPIYIKKLKSYMCMHVCIYIFILIFGRIHKMRVERTERSRYEGRKSIPVLFCLKKQQLHSSGVTPGMWLIPKLQLRESVINNLAKDMFLSW